MEESVEIRVPFKAIGKQRPKHTYFKTPMGRIVQKTYTPLKTKKAENVIAWYAKEAMKGREPFDCNVSVKIIANYKPPASDSAKMKARKIGKHKGTKPDLDNVQKLAYDACNGIVYRDDALIVHNENDKMFAEEDELIIRVEKVVEDS